MADFFGDLFGGSSLLQVAGGKGLTKKQKQLVNMQIQLAELQLQAVRSAVGTTEAAAGEGGGATPGALVQDQIQFFQDELRKLEGGVDPEQQRLIGESAERAIETGLIDIERFRTQSVEDLLGRIAPARGLRPTDSPILDRGGDIIAEATRQAGQLIGGVRGQQADFERLLREQSFQNRLRLGAGLGDIGVQQQQLGLGLASGIPVNVGGTLASIGASQPQTTSATSSNFGQGIQNIGALASGAGALIGAGSLAFSAEELKDVEGPKRKRKEGLSPKSVLDAVKKLDIRAWKYKPEARDALGLDSARHVGPMAGDWSRELTRATGGPIGDGLTIHMTDAVGASLAAIQAVNSKIDKLERRISH